MALYIKNYEKALTASAGGRSKGEDQHCDHDSDEKSGEYNERG